jgi:toxin ParE1/3/4
MVRRRRILSHEGVRLTPAAREDLDAIWSYIAKESPGAADCFLRRLSDRMYQLPRAPYVGERQNQYRDGLRSIVEGAYVIFYLPTDDSIDVHRVLHGARDLPRLFEKSDEE